MARQKSINVKLKPDTSQEGWTPKETLSTRDVLAHAVMNGTAPPEALERYEDREARKAFNVAVAQAKLELPAIIKNRTANNGGRDYRYEDLGEVIRSIDPILTAHGLLARFRTSSVGNVVTVACVLSHEQGHTSEENSLSCGLDNTGNKNQIQALGSAVTYLSRYTLKAALGLAASADDDGQAVGDVTKVNDEQINDEQIAALEALMDEVAANKQKFCGYMGIQYLADLPASRYSDAVAALETKRGK